MRLRNFCRILAVYGAIAVLVMAIILVINGVPTSAHLTLASGLGTSQAPVRSVLIDGDFASGRPIAIGWKQENSTAAAPTYLRTGEVQEIAYAGTARDVGRGRKIEVFQAIWKGVKPGQRWQFSISVRGAVSKSYTIVGMEWFSVYKHTVDGVTGYGYNYIHEQDVYPSVGQAWERVTDISPPMPAQAKCLAVYVQLPEINSATRVDIEIRMASLGLLSAGQR